jgi:hypothetical protein
MARVIESDADVDGGEVVVERKVVPVRSRTSPLAIVVLIAFVATCAVVFYHARGPADPAPVPPAQTTTPQ